MLRSTACNCLISVECGCLGALYCVGRIGGASGGSNFLRPASNNLLQAIALLQPYVAMNFLQVLRMIRQALWVFFQLYVFASCLSVVVFLFVSFFTVGTSPVHIASALNWPKAIDLLAAAGASVDAPANSFEVTPLHIAVGSGHADATRALLRAGASIEAVFGESSASIEEISLTGGATALHMAALKDQHAMSCWRQQVHRSRHHCQAGRQRCTWPHTKATGWRSQRWCLVVRRSRRKARRLGTHRCTWRLKVAMWK